MKKSISFEIKEMENARRKGRNKALKSKLGKGATSLVWRLELGFGEFLRETLEMEHHRAEREFEDGVRRDRVIKGAVRQKEKLR